jgi:MFS family permease
VLEHRERTEGGGHDELAPDDPRRITDDGTLMTFDEEPAWAPAAPVTRTETVPATEEVRTRRGYTWGQVLIALAGLAALVFGVGTVVLAGLAGSITEPIVDVFGYTHTPLLGVIEVGVGVVFILAALVPGGRWVAGPIAGGVIAGGALILAEYPWTQTELAAEQRFGWVAIAVGAAAYLGAMVPTRKRVTVER